MNKISVITVCLNAEQYIAETMRSILEQTWQNLEYIIIDGASSDNTLNIIHTIASEYPNRDIHITSEPDTGIYNAMNKGISQITGDWVNFMNAGDTFVSIDVLEHLFNYNIEHSITVLYGNDVYLGPRRDIINIRKDIAQFNHGSPFCHQASFTRAKVLKLYGFDENFKIAADYNFFLQIFRAGFKFKHINLLVANFRYGGISSICPRALLDEQEIAYGSFGSISYYVRKFYWYIYFWTSTFINKLKAYRKKN